LLNPLEARAVTQELRKTGISLVGDVPWGTHFCHFYQTKQDLLDTLIPYFKAGLESNEFCLWIVSDSDLITVEEAKGALTQTVPDLDRHLSDGNIEILDRHDWYFEKDVLNLERVTSAWDAKVKRALALGYDGMRVSADTFWLAEKDWKDFFAYEKRVNDWITDQFMTVSCTYPLAKSGAAEVLDVVQAHQFAIARRHGEWEVIETPELIQAKAEIKRLNEELEQRVVERTGELRLANEELRKEMIERKQAEASLHVKEQEFRAIVENAPDHIIRYDREFRRVYVNPAVAETYGLPAEALIGKPIGSVIQDAGLDVKDDELAQVRQRIQAVFDTGKSCEFEIAWPTPSGRKYYSSRLFPELDLRGLVINVLGIARDITERKRAEEELAERLRFETLVTELSAAFANLSPNQVDREIDKWLQILAEFLSVNRASFFQFEDNWETLYRSHSYTVAGIEPLPPAPMGMKDQFPWITDQLRQGLTVKWERIPDDMPEEAAKEKDYAARLGVKSGLNIPVRMGGSVICAITFTSLATYRDWPDTLVARLRLVGEIFAAAVERKRADAERKRADEALRESEARNRAILKALPDLIFLLTNDGVFLDYYAKDTRDLLVRPEQFLGKHVKDVLPPELADSLTRDFQGMTEESETRVLEYPLQVGEDHRYFEARIVRCNSDKILCVARNITERKQAEDDLRKQKEILQTIIDNIPVMIRFLGPDGSILVNRAWEQTLGWSLEEVRQLKFDLFNELYPDPQERQLATEFITAATGNWEDFKIQVRDGRVINATFINIRLSDGTNISIGQDITERKQAEKQLEATTKQLRALSASLQSAREQESARIAREIHDELGGALTSLRWDLEAIDDAISEATDFTQLGDLRTKIETMITLTATTLDTIKRLASELRPMVLDELGLVDAIEWQTAQFETRTGIAVQYVCPLEKVDLNREQSTAVFRILQEAMTNILRHAQATNVNIIMTQKAGEFELTIKDNGRGITESQTSGTQSLGLLGMRERAHLVGAQIEIAGMPGKGTLVAVRIPLSVSQKT
jgi:PAS domain S-box-containing protein